MTVAERMAFVLRLLQDTSEPFPVVKALAQDALDAYDAAQQPVGLPPPNMQRIADERAARWWNEKGDTADIRRNRVRVGAKLARAAISNLEYGDVAEHQRKLIVHASTILTRIDDLVGAG